MRRLSRQLQQVPDLEVLKTIFKSPSKTVAPTFKTEMPESSVIPFLSVAVPAPERIRELKNYMPIIYEKEFKAKPLVYRNEFENTRHSAQMIEDSPHLGFSHDRFSMPGFFIDVNHDGRTVTFVLQPPISRKKMKI